jgi:hypothetical protein
MDHIPLEIESFSEKFEKGEKVLGDERGDESFSSRKKGINKVKGLCKRLASIPC